MSCKREHHECNKHYTDGFCCVNCSEYQIEICIENDKVCDCLWDEGCSLDKDIYIKSIPCEKSYLNKIESNKPNNL